MTALAAALLLVAPCAAAAKAGAFRESAHGRRETGVLRVPGIPRGECAHCHGAPRDRTGRRAEGEGHLQPFAAGNSLCTSCHGRAAGSWLGELRYDRSAHGAEVGTVWPGPEPRARDARDGGKCVNCHDPHGVRDASGVVPSLLVARGAALCLACHAGNPGQDVAAALAKPYRHPLSFDDGAATSAAGAPPRAPSLAGVGLGADRGACSACHNPHAAESDPGGRPAGVARALFGVARARIGSAPAGAARTQTPGGLDDAAPVREHEVCYRCHSASAPRPARTATVAAAFNPANASFHPVEAQGRSRTIDRRAFAPGWGPERLVTCSDCHGSEDGETRGPHGSSYPRILRGRYAAALVDQPMLEGDLCFACHAFRTYGDPLARDEVAYSRFPGHAQHVSKGYSCWACHVAHGSAELPALLTLRSRGLRSFALLPQGGACTAACHLATRPDASYRSAYLR